MGRKKTRRSHQGSGERRHRAGERHEVAQPAEIKSEGELYNEALAALREAAAREDLPETIRQAEALRARFPQGAEGYQIGSKALRDSKRFGEVEALLREAMPRFPDQAWPLVEFAWAAHVKGDWDEAIRRAADLRERFPTHPAGYRVAAADLRESKRFEEVNAVAREAMTRFPDEAWPLVESAWAAEGSRDWEAAIQCAELLRTRFPLQQAGYRVGIHALRRMKRLEEANAVLREAELRIPGAVWISSVD
jgi:tetratricopeptide (TPR) repeat protein